MSTCYTCSGLGVLPERFCVIACDGRRCPVCHGSGSRVPLLDLTGESYDEDAALLEVIDPNGTVLASANLKTPWRPVKV